MPRLTLSINSDLEDVSLLAVAINRICYFLGLGDARSNEAELCIVEAVTNVIRHSYHREPGHRVDVEVETGADRVTFRITDNGTPMNAEQAERLIHGTDAVESDSLEADLLAEGGRGLRIIHELMDEVAYRIERDKHHLTLVKRIKEINPN